MFEEIGLEFARYLEECPARDGRCKFLDALRPATLPDGQRYLRSAFERYNA